MAKRVIKWTDVVLQLFIGIWAYLSLFRFLENPEDLDFLKFVILWCVNFVSIIVALIISFKKVTTVFYMGALVIAICVPFAVIIGFFCMITMVLAWVTVLIAIFYFLWYIVYFLFLVGDAIMFKQIPSFKLRK